MKKNKLDINELNSISGGEIPSNEPASGSLEKEQLINKLLNNEDQTMHVQYAMRLQYELMQLNLQTETTTKVGSKTGAVGTLFKNQSSPEE